MYGKRNEHGTILVVASLGMMALIGVAALTVDIGRLVIAAQVAQDMADAAALGEQSFDMAQCCGQDPGPSRLDDPFRVDRRTGQAARLTTSTESEAVL